MVRKRKELSNDVKKVVWSLLERGDSIRKVSEILGIPPTTISSVKKRTEEICSVKKSDEGACLQNCQIAITADWKG